MSIIERYHKIFDKEILQKSRGVIFSFSPLQDQFIYQPYSHNISADSVEKLGELMRHNLFFYSYGEEEVVQHYEKDHFSSLEQAAKYAYINRLPKRADITDGLPSEVLLDLLVQLYNPQACKLAVRTILRQNDNNEIKGYIYNSNLSHRAKSVYMYLKDRADSEGRCWPAIRTIALELGLSRSTVKRALDDLCRAGLLQKDPRWRENGSLTSNLYHVV